MSLHRVIILHYVWLSFVWRMHALLKQNHRPAGMQLKLNQPAMQQPPPVLLSAYRITVAGREWLGWMAVGVYGEAEGGIEINFRAMQVKRG